MFDGDIPARVRITWCYCLYCGHEPERWSWRPEVFQVMGLLGVTETAVENGGMG